MTGRSVSPLRRLPTVPRGFHASTRSKPGDDCVSAPPWPFEIRSADCCRCQTLGTKKNNNCCWQRLQRWERRRRQIRKMTKAKLNMIGKINDLLRKQTQNMERFLEKIKEKEKKDEA
jgi:hypothetical protein